MNAKSSKPQEKAKGRALKNLRKAMKITQAQFGKLLGKGFSRQQVSSWERGFFWPDELEPVFEQIFKIAPASFARIGIGVPYPEALKNPLTPLEESPPTPYSDKIFQQLKEIMERPEADKWQDHLRRQVGLIHDTVTRDNDKTDTE